MPDKSRIIKLEGSRRDRAKNQSTTYGGDAAALRAELYGEAFRRCYSEIRSRCDSFDQLGVAIFAVDTLGGALAGSVCIAAKTRAINTAVIGRHSEADLFLDNDDNVSLRHLLLVLHPSVGSFDPYDLRYRLLDLRTSAAFFDERGKRLEALEAEGPTFVGCSRYILFVLPTGDPTGWPESADEGWACIPDRIYLHETEAEPDRWDRQRPAASVNNNAAGGAERRRSIMIAREGPGRATLFAKASDRALGALRVSSAGKAQALSVGIKSAKSGILIGRYDRCDTDGATLLTHENISRVHLLVIQIAGTLYAIDTASTHGMALAGGSRSRVIPLDPKRELLLGDDLARIRWQPRPGST